jgi:hypothetical protein
METVEVMVETTAVATAAAAATASEASAAVRAVRSPEEVPTPEVRPSLTSRDHQVLFAVTSVASYVKASGAAPTLLARTRTFPTRLPLLETAEVVNQLPTLSPVCLISLLQPTAAVFLSERSVWLPLRRFNATVDLEEVYVKQAPRVSAPALTPTFPLLLLGNHLPAQRVLPALPVLPGPSWVVPRVRQLSPLALVLLGSLKRRQRRRQSHSHRDAVSLHTPI